MKTRRQWVSAIATVAVIAAAATLWHNLPIPDQVYASFDVNAQMGQQAEGRAITAEVSGVRIAPQIRREQTGAQVLNAVGNWVVVDAAAMTTRTPAVPRVELQIGPNTYVPTDRLGFLPLNGVIAPGITVTDAWVFDVPADLVAPGRGAMTLRVWVGDWRMDSRLVVDIGLDDARIDRSDLIRLGPATQVGT